MKYVILQGDGMPDHPVPELDGLTPLEAAHTPNLDEFARSSAFGLVKTIPDGFPPGSDVGNLGVLGYDPVLYYTGRSPLEAASMGVRVGEGDVTYRCNLVTLSGGGEGGEWGGVIMEDYSAGHITTGEARELIASIKALEGEGIEFFPGVSYRHLLLWHGGRDDIKTTPPHDISGRAVEGYLPSGPGSERLLRMMNEARRILRDHSVNLRREAEGKNPANGIWLWGAGRAPKMPSFGELYGVEGAVISAVDLVKGIGVYAGLVVVDVPGATGYLDTNYEGKVEGALEALNEVDLVMVHIEATDETGHVGDAKLKVQAVEDFDSRVVGPVLDGLRERFSDYRVMILSDHPTPLDVRTHVSEPVPFGVLSSDDLDVKAPGLVYSEKAAASTGVYVDACWKLMSVLLGQESLA